MSGKSCLLFGPALAIMLAASTASAERINHAGRILGPEPVITNVILFNTAEADGILSSMQIFPRDNPWNEDVSQRPVLPNSDGMIAQIISDLAPDRRTLRAFFEMNFVLVPVNQPLEPIDLYLYGDESDPGPYPIPANLPIETWPRETGSLSLLQWQRDINNEGGDRHAIIVQPGTGDLYETWLTKLNGGNWEAANGARFNLNTNGLRPDGWTSGDAAGLPMFPALPRYDECERGAVEHALRIVVKRTRREYLYPATHHASSTSATLTNVPAMGQRLRLKSSFVIPDSWSVHERAVLNALKKYGALVADNGNFFSISVTPDDRWPVDAFDHFSSISITNFEVIQTTGPDEGPRSPGGPIAYAGPDQVVSNGSVAALTGFAGSSEVAQVNWSVYAGPGQASFGDAAQTNTTVEFSAPGQYTLMLKVDDGVHTPAYDATIVTVTPAIDLRITAGEANVLLEWSGGEPPYEVETTGGLPATNWSHLLSTGGTNAIIPASNASALFRLKSAR